MPSFSRVRSTRLLASCLVLVLSLVCSVRMENIVLLQPPCCMLSILSAIFVWPLLLLHVVGNMLAFFIFISCSGTLGRFFGYFGSYFVAVYSYVGLDPGEPCLPSASHQASNLFF